MKLQLVILILALLFITNCRIHHNPAVLGAPTGALTDPDQIAKAPGMFRIALFVMTQKPELKGSKIISLRTQLVAGTNYFITYLTPQGKKVEVTVYQALDNTRRITSYQEVA